MSKLYLGSIDVNKIDKSYIKEWTSKDGSKSGKSIDVAIWINDETNSYGQDGSISMGDKDNKIYIGNIKEYKKEDNGVPNKPQPQSDSTDDDLPF